MKRVKWLLLGIAVGAYLKNNNYSEEEVEEKVPGQILNVDREIGYGIMFSDLTEEMQLRFLAVNMKFANEVINRNYEKAFFAALDKEQI